MSEPGILRTAPELAAFAASAHESFRFLVDEYEFAWPRFDDHAVYVVIEYRSRKSRSPCLVEIYADNESGEDLNIGLTFTPIIERPLPSQDPDLFDHLGVAGSRLSLKRVMERRDPEWKMPVPKPTVAEAVEAGAYLAEVVKENCADILRGDFSEFLNPDCT